MKMYDKSFHLTFFHFRSKMQVNLSDGADADPQRRYTAKIINGENNE
jgi:hypothetical protein